MSVELLDTPRFFGYRVRRQILGKTYQEYFSLKQDGKRLRGGRRAEVKARAQARDDQLAKQQESLQRKRAKEVRIDGDGQVRGILCRLKAEKSGNRTPVFQIGVMSLLENRIVNTTVSINKFGVEEAWQRAVDFYARHKKISKRSAAYRSLIGARPSSTQVNRLVKSGNGNGRNAGTRRAAPRAPRAGRTSGPGRTPGATRAAVSARAGVSRGRAAARRKRQT